MSLLDFFMALLMGLIIFPAVKSFGIGSTTGELEGTTLVFVTLPEIFASMGNERLWAALFFLLLSVAALTSTISIAEVSVAFVRDRFRVSRRRACLIVIVPLMLTSTACSLSLGGAKWLSVAGMPLFDFFDTFTTNLLLPVSSLAISIYVGWVLPKSFIAEQLTNFGTLGCRSVGVVRFAVRYVAPVLISVILIAKAVAWL